jgi:hypothetical protein
VTILFKRHYCRIPDPSEHRFGRCYISCTCLYGRLHYGKLEVHFIFQVLLYCTYIPRSRTFSLSLGLLFAGSSLGPTFGGLIIRETKQTLSVFYVAATVHLLYAILTWVFLPESVSSMQMAKALVRHREERGTITRERGESNSMRVLMWARPAFQFLSPLSIFLPRVERQASPLKGPSRDWGLTMLVLAYGLTITTMASCKGYVGCLLIDMPVVSGVTDD